MEVKNVDIVTVKDKFFRQYLEIVKVFFPYNLLRNAELDVLAEFCYYNDQYKQLDKDTRWKLILHFDTKIKIKDKLKLSDASFNNIITSFRKKGILVGDKVPSKYMIEVENKFKININFLINGN